MRTILFSYRSKYLPKELHLFSRSTFKHQPRLYRFIGASRPSFSIGNDPAALAAFLSSSEGSLSPFIGAQIHGYVFKIGLPNDVFTQNNLIRAYAHGGLLDDGFKVFEEMSQRSVFSWTLLISGAIHCGKFELSMYLFLEMMRTGLMPNEFAIGSVMKVCANARRSELGTSVHCFAYKIGMQSNLYVGGSILNFYAKVGDIEGAENIFRCMDNVDTGCWNAMIGGYTHCGYGPEAINLISLMRFEGVSMDKYTYIGACQGCSLVCNLDFGKEIHGLIVRSEMDSSTSVMNALMDMYIKSDKTSFALKVFQWMHNKDIVSFNTMLGSQLEDPRELVTLYYDLSLNDVRPNHITFSTLFRQCGELLHLYLGLQFYCLACHFGFFDDVKITSSVIYMLSSCGAMEMVHPVFDNELFKDITIWNQLISGYSWNSGDFKAIETFYSLFQMGIEANECTFTNVLESCIRMESKQMFKQIHGIVIKFGFSSDGCICSSLIKGYVNFGLLVDSFELFSELEELDLPSWSTMISTLVHQGYDYEAIGFFKTLIDCGKRPDEFIFSSILNSAAAIAAYYQTKFVHAFTFRTGYDTYIFVASAILDAYAKCGDIKSARMVFDLSFEEKDIVIYNAMIMAYAHHGLVVEAIEIFDKLRTSNLQPNQATFVSLISACGHLGLVDKGCFFFHSMKSKHGVEPSPDVYGCLVDMFARNGYLQNAKDVIEIMPHPPWPAILRSLLSGCRTYGNRELGEWAAKKLLLLVPEDGAAFVLLSKVYSEVGSWDDAAKVRKGMWKGVLRKDLGHSWIEA